MSPRLHSDAERLPGELVRIDVKRIDGPSLRRPGYIHTAVDDATRLAYVEILADEHATTSAGFVGRAVASYAKLGLRVQHVLVSPPVVAASA